MRAVEREWGVQQRRPAEGTTRPKGQHNTASQPDFLQRWGQMGNMEGEILKEDMHGGIISRCIT